MDETDAGSVTGDRETRAEGIGRGDHLRPGDDLGAADALLGMRREGDRRYQPNAAMHGQSLFAVDELRDNRKQGQKVKVMPDLYDGTGNWGDYLTHFKVVAELNGWTQRERQQFLAVSLRGEACKMLPSLPEDARWNFDAFVEALGRRFNPGDKTELYRIQLRNYTRKDKESIPQLAQTVRNLAIKAYPEACGNLLEMLCRDHFIDALNEPDMRFRIFQSKVATLDQAVGVAVEMEAFQMAEKHRGNAYSRKMVREITSSSGGQNGQEFEAKMRESMESLTKAVSSLKEEVQQLKYKRNKNSENFRCWNCGNQGHSRKDCTKERQGDGFGFKPRGDRSKLSN